MSPTRRSDRSSTPAPGAAAPPPGAAAPPPGAGAPPPATASAPAPAPPSGSAAGAAHRTSSTVEVATSAGPVGVRLAGPDDGDVVVLLHGWPQTGAAWDGVAAAAAADGYRTVAPDLPGIGASLDARTDGSTDAIADVVDEVLGALGLEDATLVGNDLGGMVTFTYLVRHRPTTGTPRRVRRAAVVSTVLPGVPPWDQVIANPYVWHFAFHALPELPELLVQDHVSRYLDYFYEVLSPARDSVPRAVRDTYVAAYEVPQALAAGFDWYRGLPGAARSNRAQAAAGPVLRPLLYVRGGHESGDPAVYAEGLRGVGVRDVRTAVVPGAGHFVAEEAPDALWAVLRRFVESTR